MKGNRFFGEFKAFLSQLKAKLKLSLRSPSAKHSDLEKKLSSENPKSTAYQLIGDKMERLLPLFKDLAPTLRKSGLKVNVNAYVSLAILVAVSTSFVVLASLPCLLFPLFHVPLFPAILFGIGGSLFTFAFTTIGFYFYPIYRADSLKRALEDELPFTTGYMAILTDAGVSPEKVFHSLSSLTVPLAISKKAKDIVRDVNLFGSDIISALSEASEQSPSERFREMIEGFISTIHSGGDLAVYLREKSRQYMKLKRIGLKKFSDTLSMLSEFYVALLLTGPLLFVIMLTVMAMLGGGNLGLLSPDLLLSLVTYIGIPLGAIVFVIILDAASPKW